MQYTCPKCGKRIDLSVEQLIASEYKTVCPQCLSQLEIVGDYAYIPLEDGSLELRRDGGQAADEAAIAQAADEASVAVLPPPPVPPVLPSQLGGDGRDPLYAEAVRYLSQCSAITPMMLRDYFNIPLERAQDLIAQLEKGGCIGPYRGGAPRQILIDHREGLPNPYNYRQQYDPNAQPESPAGETEGGKTLRINCGSCLIWLVLLAFLIFLLVK